MSVLLRILLALALGTAGGVSFWLLHLPLPWMLGAMLFTTIAAVAGLKLHGPNRIRPAVIATIGVLLGSGFTPELLAKAGGLLTSLVLLVIYLAASAAIVIPYYRRVGKFDPVTAYFSAMPGGLTEMVLIGEHAGGDSRKIILAHAARIFVCVFLIAFWFRMVLGVNVSSAVRAGFGDLSLLDAAILIAAGVIGVPLARLCRFPAPELLGPMLLSAGAHLANLTHIAPPGALVSAAQVALGTMLGCRFVGTPAPEVGRALLLALGATVLTLLIAAGAALVAAKISGFPSAQILLAYAPGGLSEMSLIALALKADVAFVAVQHIARIILVVGAAPLVFRLLQPPK